MNLENEEEDPALSASPSPDSEQWLSKILEIVKLEDGKTPARKSSEIALPDLNLPYQVKEWGAKRERINRQPVPVEDAVPGVVDEEVEDDFINQVLIADALSLRSAETLEEYFAKIESNKRDRRIPVDNVEQRALVERIALRARKAYEDAQAASLFSHAHVVGLLRAARAAPHDEREAAFAAHKIAQDDHLAKCNLSNDLYKAWKTAADMLVLDGDEGAAEPGAADAIA